jgi:hypothetical protein
MLSLVSVAASGFLLFCFTRPFVGVLPALVAQAAFLFSPAQTHALGALPETPMLLFALLGALFLFLGSGRVSAYASGVAFVIALLIKPTCFVMIVAAVLSLVYARAWRRLRDLAAAGVAAAAAGLTWTFFISDGVFAEILRFQVVERIAARRASMWSVDSGFGELRRFVGAEGPGGWALYSLRNFCLFPQTYLPLVFLAISLAGVPIWALGCARSRPALQAFSVLWPAAYLLLNFVGLDFVSAKYFIPLLAVASFLLAGVLWLAQRHVPPLVATAAAVVICAALLIHFASRGTHGFREYYQRAGEITHQHPMAVSFSPMLFAATGTEPGCGFANPALTYGSIGQTFLGSARTRGFQFSDERLIECLRANRQAVVVLDLWFYLFTRPGSPLREYVRGEGSAQALAFFPEELKRLATVFDLR